VSTYTTAEMVCFGSSHVLKINSHMCLSCCASCMPFVTILYVILIILGSGFEEINFVSRIWWASELLWVWL